jgi:hypothetical protein
MTEVSPYGADATVVVALLDAVVDLPTPFDCVVDLLLAEDEVGMTESGLHGSVLSVVFFTWHNDRVRRPRAHRQYGVDP